MIHNILLVLPYFGYLTVAAAVVGGLAWWACLLFEGTDEWMTGGADDDRN